MTNHSFTRESQPLLSPRVSPPRNVSTVGFWVLLCGFVAFFSFCGLSLIEYGGQQVLESFSPLLGASDSDSSSSTFEPFDESIQVYVEQGTLQGKRMKSRAGRDYLAFLGIPYAQPPTGDLRFKVCPDYRCA